MDGYRKDMTGMNSCVASRKIQGERDYQEDACEMLNGIDGLDDHRLLVVADGMGGHAGGEVASDTVVNAFLENYPKFSGSPPDRLHSCLEAANEAIAAAVVERPELNGMGSTVVAAAISGRELYWVSVGDSPMWIFRKSRLKRINADHSMVPELERMMKDGYLTEEQVANDSRRHMLRSAIMGKDIPLRDNPKGPKMLEPGDWLLLASDGVMVLDEGKIAKTIGDACAADAQDVAAALIQAVEDARHPHQDNTTVSLYAVAAG